jgi:hypothetical protein
MSAMGYAILEIDHARIISTFATLGEAQSAFDRIAEADSTAETDLGILEFDDKTGKAVGELLHRVVA